MQCKPLAAFPQKLGSVNKKVGMKPGPGLGAMLEEIRERQLADELTTRQDAIKWAVARIKPD